MTFANELKAGLFLAAVLTIAALIGWGYHQKTLREKAEAAYTEQSVELAGAKKALLVTPKEVVKFVEVPAAVKAAVKSGVLAPIAAGKLSATSNVVNIPCPPSVPLDAPSLSEGQEVKPDSPPQVAVTFGLTGEIFIGKIKGGAVEHTSTFKATVRAVDDSWNSDITFEPENVVFDVKVSKEVAQAMDAYNKTWLQKHMRFMCPGVGIVYNPLDPTRPVQVGISCSYGVVW